MLLASFAPAYGRRMYDPLEGGGSIAKGGGIWLNPDENWVTMRSVLAVV